MATEAWVLDGVAVTSGNFSMLELNVDPPKERADWITAADSESAALSRQPLHENRTITMKLRVAPQASMDAALDQVAAIRDKLEKASSTQDGVGLVWTPANSARSRTFDVLTGEISELPIENDGQGRSWLQSRPLFTVVLTCKPYWRDAEVLSSTSSGSKPAVQIELASIPGDIPALGRLIVTDTAATARRHVEWGIENQYYVASSALEGGTRPIIIDSDDMTVTGFIGVQTAGVTGAYDPNAAGNNAIVASLYRSAPAAIAGTGNFGHVGTFRVKCRASSNSNATRLRLAWQEGEGPWQTNPWAACPVFSAFGEWDLGLITIPPKVSGTQRWQGRIEGMVASGISDTVTVDYIILIPAAEGYGKSRASYMYVPGPRIARDEFTATTAGNPLSARVAPLGGTWGTTGSATDFGFADAPGTEESVQRSTTADSVPGRVAVMGSAVTADEVGVRVFNAAASTDPNQTNNVIARYVDVNNYVYAELGPTTFTIYKRVASTVTRIAQAAYGRQAVPYYIRIVVYATGFVSAMLLDAYSNILVQIQGQDTVLATGGTLASGQHGFGDFNSTANSFARYYNYFYAATPTAEPIVLNSGRTMEVRYDDTLRQDSTGTYYGRTPSYWGSRFLVPPGTSRVVVKARGGDLETTGDDAGVATQIQIGYQARGLVVPR